MHHPDREALDVTPTQGDMLVFNKHARLVLKEDAKAPHVRKRDQRIIPKGTYAYVVDRLDYPFLLVEVPEMGIPSAAVNVEFLDPHFH